MVLEFKFDYRSENNVMSLFLDKIAKNSKCNYKIFKNKNYIIMFVEGDEGELNGFSDDLSKQLPMSIFYYGLNITAKKSMPNNDEKNIVKQIKDYVSFCPNCLKEVEDENSNEFYNAFKECSICDGFKNAQFILDGKKIKSDKKLFEKLAKMIDENKKIKIKTLSGTYVFSKFFNADSSEEILLCNLENLQSMFVVSKTQLMSLASIEKPRMELNINAVYKQSNNISKDSINVRYVNDLTLYLLGKELKKIGINFLDIKEENSQNDVFLNVEYEEYKKLDLITMKCLKDKRLVIDSESYPDNLEEIYKKIPSNGKAHFMTVLTENNLFENNILSFYFSLKHDDDISLYLNNIDGLINIVKPLKIPKNMKELFESVEEDAIGERLLKNYKEKFSFDYSKALKEDISNYKNKSFFTYFKILTKALNFKEDIFESATKSLFSKGPRMDYKLVTTDGKPYNLDFEFSKLLRSAISYKVAGLDEASISRGFIDSLANFIGLQIDNFTTVHNIDGVSLSGSLFANHVFNALVEKSVTKNTKIFYNIEFPIE